jgi:Fic family protein
LTPEYLDRLRFDAEQAAALRAIGEFRGKQALFYRQAPEVLKGLREIAVIESSESSNRLAGVIVPAKRLKALIAQNTTPRDRSEQEVAGYRDALALILQLHSTLYQFMPSPGGRWKATDNEIIERHQDGTVRVRFKVTPANLTPIAMEQLSTGYSAAIDVAHRDPLIVVPLVILDFLCIHPFTDGNGRGGPIHQH